MTTKQRFALALLPVLVLTVAQFVNAQAEPAQGNQPAGERVYDMERIQSK